MNQGLVALVFVSCWQIVQAQLPGSVPPPPQIWDKELKKCGPSAPLSEPNKIDLPFCTEYSNFTCCTPEQALKIKGEMEHIVSSECESCYQILKHWKVICI